MTVVISEEIADSTLSMLTYEIYIHDEELKLNF